MDRYATAFCFAISSIIFGFVSDRLGYRKKILLPFLLGTAIFSAAGVMVDSFPELLLVRALAGFCEGPVSPLIYSKLFSVNKESFGRNCGILNSSVGTIGTTIGPVFITQLAVGYSWQMTFLLSSLPTFVMFLVVFFLLRKSMLKRRLFKRVQRVPVLPIYLNTRMVSFVWSCVFWD
jgi:MFS family permease